MVRSKAPEDATENAIWHQRLKNAIWTAESFHFDTSYAIKWINSGLLGYKIDKAGNQILGTDNKPIPITVNRSTYFRYKAKYGEMPEVYKTLHDFAMSGYTKMMAGFQDELAILHQQSAQNLYSAKEPLERQSIIDSLVKNVIPTQMAFADMLKDLIDKDKLLEKSKEAETPRQA